MIDHIDPIGAVILAIVLTVVWLRIRAVQNRRGR